jgi:DNA-binding NtrC family response regulator
VAGSYADGMPGDSPREEGAAPGPDARPAGASGHTVLVVEDDPHVRLLLERLVRAADYGVRSAGSAAEALALLGAHGSEIDLLLTDIGLGDMHGGELARRALELRPGLPVVYSSGHSSATALDGMPPGDAFLLKPFRAEDLKRALDRVFAPGTG